VTGSEAVPAGVLAAFGVTGSVPVRLPGGEGTTWRAGPLVLKPTDSVPAGRWNAELCDTLADPGFRVPRPVRAVTGDWVARGWTASRWVAGTAADWSGVSPRWPGMIAVSRALHAALVGIPAPAWRVGVRDPWTIGDQVAWGERDPGPLLEPLAGPPAGQAGGQLAAQVRRLLAALAPVGLPDQLIHADLTGNVLFADPMPPAVIDFSPLYRPAGWALAIVAVDALQWHQADSGVLGLLAGEPQLDQLLARALIFRQISEVVGGGLERAARTGQPVADLILARLGQ
jgi:uncharacterized protein (TIGR02569 family)